MIRTMKAESIVIGVAGTVFGLIVGWIIGTQQAPARPFAQAAPAAAAQQVPAGAPAAAAAALDEAQAAALRNIAEKDPANAQSRVQLGNMYFDAERYQDAIQWYEAALKLNPNHKGAHEYIGEAYLMVGDVASAEKHLAALRSICLLRCDEFIELDKAIAAHRAQGKAR